MKERGCRERFKELEPEGLSEGKDQSQQRSEHEAGVCAKLTI